MTTIDEIKPEQLRSADIIKRIEEIAQPLIFHADTSDAFNLTKKLERLLAASGLETYSTGLFKQYNLLLVRLKFVALPFLSDNEAADLIKENLIKLIRDGYNDYDNAYIDAENRIWAKMASVPFSLRDELRQSFNKAMRENEERLGPKTLGEWINDYSQTFDFRERTSLSPLNYINQNPEAYALPEQEKNILRQIFYIFDRYLIVTPLVDFFEAQEIYQELIKEEQEKRPPLPVKPFVSTQGPSLPPKPQTPEPKKPEPIPAKPPVYEKVISPYEKKRKLASIMSTLNRPVFTIETPHPQPPKAEEIPTFSKETEKKTETKFEKKEPQPTTLPSPQYRIRTMKQDIEIAKRQPIPPKPTPKVKDNIVDLSGK